MRLSMRFTLGLVVGGIVLFGAQAILLLDKEGADLERAAAAEMRLLGRSIQAAIENALRDHQLEDITATLAKLESVDPATDVALFDPAGRETTASAGYEPNAGQEVGAAREALRTGDAVLRFFPPTGTPERLVHALPLSDDGGALLGAVVLVRPLTALERDLSQTRLGLLLPQVLFVLSALGLGALIGTLYVGRPLARLVAAIRRVRAGDLRALDIGVRGSDLGEIASELEAMTAELRDTRARLAAQVEAQRETERQLREADKLISLGQLAAGLAHEIGSPLQVLGGRAAALAAQLDDPARARRHAESIVVEAKRIADIVADLLRLVRRHGHRAPVDLGEVARTVVGLLEYQGRRQGVTLEVAVEAGVPRVLADPGQMQQVVLNLVRNALQAARAGDVVRVELARDAAAGAGVVLSVGDTGPGMAPEVQERLWEPFFTTRAEAGGTGLGLAVVRSLVGEHGGRVEVRSEVGVGTTFAVHLPGVSP